MSRRPGRPQRVGHRQPGHQAALGQPFGHSGRQLRFAPEQLGQPGDIEQQTFRPLRLFQAHGGTEPLTGRRQVDGAN